MSHLSSLTYKPSLEGKHLPQSIWKDGVLYLPQPIIDAHHKQLKESGWVDEYLMPTNQILLAIARLK